MKKESKTEVVEMEDTPMHKTSYALYRVRSIQHDDGALDESDPSKEDTQSEEEGKLPVKPKGSLFHFARLPHDLIYLIPAYTGAVLAGVSKPIQTILLGKVFTALGNYASGKSSKSEFMHDATIYSMSIVGVGGVLLIVNWLMLSCFDLFSANLLKRARRQMFVRFLNRDFAWYDMNKGVMGTLTTLNRCFSDLQGATTMTLALISQSLCTIVACLAISFYYSWAIAFVSLAILPLILAVTAVGSRYITNYFYNFKRIIEDVCTVVNWAIDSIATVKQFNGQDTISKKFLQDLNKASAFYFKFSIAAGIQQGITRFMVLAMFVPVFVFGSYLVHKGSVEVGSVLTVFWCSFMISGSVSSLGLRMEGLNKGQVASARIQEFLDLGMSSATYFKNMIGIFPETCEGSIVFQNVSQVEILKNIVNKI